jgi:glycosyltransferase involved in cell wall biosynthesis
MSAGKKVVIVTNIPTPYRIPLFNEIEKQLAERGSGLFVVFGAAGYGRRSWEVDLADAAFEHVVLRSGSIPYSDPERSSFTYPGLSGIIRKIDPPVVVVNGFSPAAVKLWLGSLAGGRAYVIWSGATGRDGRGGGSGVRRLARRLLVARASGYVAYGSAATDYLCSLGASRARISVGINTVDTAFYRKGADRRRGAGSADGGVRRLLTVGNLTKGKRIDVLLAMMRELLEVRGDVRLDVVGDGPERGALEKQARDLGIAESVSFTGFRRKEEVAEHYARADCFLFPSGYDIWGLVLVEAMASGLPCISSVDAGATRDLIDDGRTGYAVDFSGTGEALAKLRLLLDDAVLAERMGRAAGDFIRREVTLEKSAAGFVRAVADAQASGKG